MSHQISGDPNSFPVNFSVPDDGDARTAASVNVAFEALADRTANLDALYGNLRGIVPLNFRRVADAGGLMYAFWNEPKRRWVATATSISLNSRLAFSVDGGEVWASPGTLSQGSDHNTQGAVDELGNMVISSGNNSAQYVEYNASTDIYTVRTHGIANPGVYPPIVYDPFTQRWVWLASAPATAQAYYSSDRINWTAGASWAMGSGYSLLRAHSDGDKTIIAVSGPVSYGATNTARIHRSTDGMSSQTLVQTITASMLTGIEKIGYPIYNPYDSTWLVALPQLTGSEKSEIWRSVDGGITWTLAAALSTQAIHAIAAFGTLWAGITGQGDIVLSSDSGTTWKYSGQQVTPASFQRGGIFASPHGMLVTSFINTTTNSIYVGLRVGAGGSLVL
jgi:hypothetical protein